MSDRKATVKIDADTSSLDSKLARSNDKAVEASKKGNEALDKSQKASDIAKDTDKKSSKSLMTSRETWTYVNQLTSLFLRTAEDNIKNTKAQAALQGSLATLSAVQAETGVVRIFLEAQAAFATGNIAAGTMLLSIAAMMQQNAINSYAQQMQAIQTERRSDILRTQIESYRSNM